MKNKLLLLFSLLSLSANAQSLYDDAETVKQFDMLWTSGSFQRGVNNPSATGINTSSKVSKEVRSAEEYDAFVYNSKTAALDAGPYILTGAGSKKMTIEFYSQYPGTIVQVGLSNQILSSADYPKGRHSEYQAKTTKTNAWETLTFNLTWQPDKTVPNDAIDQFVFLIDPGKKTSVGREYYFDNFRGPDFIVSELAKTLYEDVDSVTNINYLVNTGTLTKSFSNPSSTGLNTSTKVIKYVRTSETFDAIIVEPKYSIFNLTDFVKGKKKMNLQVYSSVSGAEIDIYLVNSKINGGKPYPTGWHSAYRGFTSKVNQWETVAFDFAGRPDEFVPDLGIDQVIISVAPNKPSISTFYFDKFYGPDLFIPFGTVDLHINEFMSSNTGFIKDNFDEESDWIELYNSGDGSANLKGYTISDDSTSYSFSDLIVLPHQHVLLWASGRDTVTPNGIIHTNFSISSKGENLLLKNTKGDTVDFVSGVSLAKNMSYGRKGDGGAELVYFNEPTPGDTNSTETFTGLITAVPAFSMEGGFYTSAIDLNITDNVIGGEVRYTLDGSEPTINSPLLSGALHIENRTKEPNKLSTIKTTVIPYIQFYSPSQKISKSTTVRARIFKSGSIPGPVVTNTYFVDSLAKTHFNNLPIWSIVTDSVNMFSKEKGIYMPGQVFEDWRASNPTETIDGASPCNYNQRGPAWERPASVEFFEPNGKRGFRYNTGLKVHGGWSRGNMQKSLRLYFTDQYDTVKSLQYPLIPGLKKKYNGKPLEKFDAVLLRHSGGDGNSSFFREELSQSLISHTSVAIQAYRPSVVFIDGEYWGIYNIRERIDDDFIASHFNVDKEDVAILSLEGNVEYGTDADAADYKSLHSYIGSNDVTKPAVFENIKKRMDISNYIDYQATEIFLDNRDWPGNNIVFWKCRTGKLSEAGLGHDGRWRWGMIDTDFGFGWQGPVNYNTLDFATKAGLTVWPNPDWSTLILRTLLKNTEFKNEFINRFADHLNSSFKTERVLAKIDSLMKEIEPQVDEHTKRWKIPSDVASWKNNVNALKTFATQRPGYQRLHITNFFKLSGTANVTLDVNNKAQGEVKISSLRLNEKVPGVSANVYPWSGIYFKDVPVTITAIPKPGYRFIGWNGGTSASVDTIVTLKGDISLVANFELLTTESKYPVAHILSKGKYELNGWSSVSEPGTYPRSMIFMQSGVKDPKINAGFVSPYTLPYNLQSSTRIEAINDSGFAFINTGATDELIGGASGRDVGAALLAINTLGISGAIVSFTAGTVLPNVREQALRLQYRVGATGIFKDINFNGGPVEYSRNMVENHFNRFDEIPLPADAIDKDYVQLRWVYHYVGGTTGARAKLRLDDILVKSTLPDAVSEINQYGSVSIYPNPTTDVFNVSFNNTYTGEITIEVTDILGKSITSDVVNKQSQVINWSPEVNLNNGIYFIRWQAGVGSGVRKVIIQK